VAISVVISNYN